MSAVPLNWPTPDGDRVLKAVEDFLGRFVAFPHAEARVAVTLWAAHAHVVHAFESTPRLALLSPEPGSGKTRVLEVLELLVPRPVLSVNVTPAYLFRKVGDEAGIPTILFDEIDTVFGAKARDHEDVRGLVNAGHRRGATAGRCVVRGKVIETEELPAFAPVAMAGLGDLPDTLMSRSIVIRMRRRSMGESVTPFRRRVHISEGRRLHDQLADWCLSIVGQIQDSYPDLPETITDRSADVWEPLLALADAAGGDWPKMARRSAVALVAATRRDGGGSLGVRLLSDLRLVFGADCRLSTATILSRLLNLDESPWGDLRGRELDSRRLARMLNSFDVKPRYLRNGDDTFRGYDCGDLLDAWSRYLPNQG